MFVNTFNISRRRGARASKNCGDIQDLITKVQAELDDSIGLLEKN